MHFSIKYKILLTLITAIAMVIGGMWLFTKLSFERGFVNYVRSMDEEVQSRLVQALAREYRNEGSWDALRDNPRRWREFQIESLAHAGAPRMAWRFPMDPGHDVIHFIRHDALPMPPPHPGAKFERRVGRFGPFGARMLLLDADKEPLSGNVQPEEALKMTPIVVDGATVGYLAMRPIPPMGEAREMHFSERQAHAFMLIALITMVVSILLALPVSRQLVKPIRALSEATRKLAAGSYDTRIDVGSRDELGQLARDFNSLAKTLGQNEVSRRQWIADISHELRTPLSILQGEIEAMQDGLRPCTPERLAALHGETLNLARLVNDLYELSLSDIGALSYQKQRLDLRTLLETSLQAHRDEFAGKNIALEFSADPGLEARVFGDPDRLQQLFLNLLGNSLRYTDPGGKVAVSLAVRDGHAVIDVQDSAPGVAEEHLPRLFERLYRVDPSRSRETGGAGLGLAICRNIVEAHDGRIDARASNLGGLWVQLVLPLEA